MSDELKISVAEIREAVAAKDWDEQVSIETLLERGRLTLFRWELQRAINEVLAESVKP